MEKNISFSFSNILREKYFYFSTLLNSNKKTSGVNIDLNKYVTVLKQSSNFNWSRFEIMDSHTHTQHEVCLAPALKT